MKQVAISRINFINSSFIFPICMKRFLIWLLSPALRAICNYIDKYLLSKIFNEESNLSVLLIFSSAIWIIALPFIWMFANNVFAISTMHKLVMIWWGIWYILSLIPYLYAINKEDASTVVPLFQLIAPISLILGYFILGEALTMNQFRGFLIVLWASIILSLDFSKKLKFKYKVFFLMLLSCFLTSLMYIAFKWVNVDTSFATTMFWQYVWFAIMTLVLLLIPGYAKSFFRLFKKSAYKVVSLNLLNEWLNVGAIFIMNYISLLTLVWVAQLINWFQPIFVFIYGILLTLLFPHIIKEEYSKTIIIQKILCFICMLFWLYLISL